jgi:hypothetical protein
VIESVPIEIVSMCGAAMFTIVLSLLVECVTRLDWPMPPATDYSADRIVEGAAGTLGGKFYSTLDKERVETRANGDVSIVIVRRDMQGGYLLMPEQKKYQGLRLRSALNTTRAPSLAEMDLTPIGRETLDGQRTTICRARLKDGSAAGFVWLTSDRIPVRMELSTGRGPAAKRLTIRLKNIVRGAQSPALFELPGGYSSIPSPGAMGMSGGSTIW